MQRGGILTAQQNAFGLGVSNGNRNDVIVLSKNAAVLGIDCARIPLTRVSSSKSTFRARRVNHARALKNFATALRK